MKFYLRGAWSWDLGIGVIFGCTLAALALSAEVREQGVTVALAAGAFAVAIMSVVLGALAVITAFFDGPYRRVLEHAGGGVREALAAYFVVVAVAGAAALAALVTALGWPVFCKWGQMASIGVTGLLTGWSVAGMVSLVELTIFHAVQRAKLMQGIDKAAQVGAPQVRPNAPE
ncbi:MAG: hypothetical protein GXY03_04500 [Solirubrobacterales bacterium]|nr:hypothetical protein [Solirubrobacterales bacterium]